MKRINLLLILLFLFTSELLAQEEKNTLKINPLSALFRTGSVFYEYAISDRSSVQLGVAYVGLKLDETKFSGLAITPEYRYYIKHQAPRGLYLAPYGRYQNYTISDGTSRGSYNSFGGGFLLGRQWIYSSGFALDMFLGPSFNSGTYKAESGSGTPDLKGGIDGIGLRVGLAIGFGF